MAGDTLRIAIDGRKLIGMADESILEVARRSGTEIPTLCYHESLLPWGSCRLCVVEAEAQGRTRIVASCVTPIEDGLVVRTDTPMVNEIRRMILTLLLARCPDLAILKEYGKRFGIKRIPFGRQKEDCFLCGMCVRACSEIVGVSAIGFVNRGTKTRVQAPFGTASGVCIGCGTCTVICPAKTLTLEKVFARQTMHRKATKTVARCTICENHYMGT